MKNVCLLCTIVLLLLSFKGRSDVGTSYPVTLSGASSSENHVCSVSDGNGGVLQLWIDNRLNWSNANSYATQVMVQRIDSNGTRYFSNNGSSKTGASFASIPYGSTKFQTQLVSDGANGAIILWQYNDITGGHIYAQRISYSGNIVFANWGSNVSINTPSVTDSVFYMQAVSDNNGGAIISWTKVGSNGNPVIYAQRINASGITQWAAGGVSICNSNYTKSAQKMKQDGSGGAVIAWRRESGTKGFYAQHIQSNGLAQWTINGVLAYTENFTVTNGAFDIAVSSGGIIIAFQGLPVGSTNYVVKAARLNSSGVATFGSSGILLNNLNTDTSSTIITTDDGAEGAVIAWEDSRYTTTRLFAQRIASTGSLYWVLNGVQISQGYQSVSNASHLQMLTLGTDYYFVWADSYKRLEMQKSDANGITQWLSSSNRFNPQTDDRISQLVSSGNSLFASWTPYTAYSFYNLNCNQRISTSGVERWDKRGVRTVEMEDHLSVPPVACTNSKKGAYFVWEDLRTTDSSKIYFKEIDSLRSPKGSSHGNPVAMNAFTQYQPSVTEDGTGGIIAVWQNRNGSSFDIYAQRIDSNRNRMWTEAGIPICISTGTQQHPKVINDSSGGFIIVWEDKRSGSNEHIYSQKVNLSGTIQWAANGIPVCTAGGRHYNFDVIALAASGCVVSWQDTRNTNSDIFAQRISSTGTMSWTVNGLAVCDQANEQTDVDMCLSGTNVTLFTWADNRSGHSDIYIQRFNSNGSKQFSTNGINICNAAGDQRYPAIISDQSGGAIVSWSDQRLVNSCIYAQRVNSSGAILWTLNGVSAGTNSASDSIAIRKVAMVSDDMKGAIIAVEAFDHFISQEHQIFASKLDSTGVLRWNRVMSKNETHAYSPALVANSKSGAFVGWRSDEDYVPFHSIADQMNADGWVGILPDIEVTGNQVIILNDEAHSIPPNALNNTDFGIINVGSSVTKTFKVFNRDYWPLYINYMKLVGEHGEHFTITAINDTTIERSDSITFSITFQPLNVGLKTMYVKIYSNDPDEGSFYMTIQGRGRQKAIINTIAGNGSVGTGGNGGMALLAELHTPTAIAADTAGNIYVADSANHVVRRIDSNGVISIFAGTGIGGYNGENITRLSAQISSPVALFFRKQNGGELYLSETGNQRIRKISLSTGLIRTIVGTGVAGFNGDGAIGTLTQINKPMGMCSDGTYLYFADNANHRVRRIHLTSNIVATTAGNGIAGFSGDGASATLAKLNNPTDVCLNNAANTLYIADYNNARIRKIVFGIITTYIGTGTHGYNGSTPLASAQLNHPRGVLVDSNDVLYVLDGDNQRIRYVSPLLFVGDVLSTFGGTGIAGFSGDGGLASLAKINAPTSFCFDEKNNLYFSDKANHRVRVIGDLTEPAFYSKQLLQGYYQYDGVMQSVLFNQSVSTNPYLCDTVLVELHQSTAPYNLMFSEKVVMNINGIAACNFAHVHGTFYLAIKHRNSIAVWSANPITISGNSFTYDFNIPSKAYGNQLAYINIFYNGIFSGDINQDENVDLIDLAGVENDISNFESGYFATDINGDGNVDLLDAPIVEENLNGFIFSNHP